MNGLVFCASDSGGIRLLWKGELREPIRPSTERFPVVSPNQTASDLDRKVQPRPQVTVYKNCCIPWQEDR